MAEIFGSPVSVQATLRLDESELRALDALATCSTDAFLEMFYTNLGRQHLAPYEQGLRSLFFAIRRDLPECLSNADAVRKALGMSGAPATTSTNDLQPQEEPVNP